MKLSLTIMAMLLVCSIALAAESKLCAKDDLIGQWESVAVKVNPAYEGNADAGFYPYQRYAFDASGKMKILTSTKPFDVAADVIWNNFPNSISYTVDRRGVIAQSGPELPRTQYEACDIIISGDQKVNAGDMILTSYTANGAPYGQKVFKKKA